MKTDDHEHKTHEDDPSIDIEDNANGEIKRILSVQPILTVVFSALEMSLSEIGISFCKLVEFRLMGNVADRRRRNMSSLAYSCPRMFSLLLSLLSESSWAFPSLKDP